MSNLCYKDDESIDKFNKAFDEYIKTEDCKKHEELHKTMKPNLLHVKALMSRKY